MLKFALFLVISH